MRLDLKTKVKVGFRNKVNQLTGAMEGMIEAIKSNHIYVNIPIGLTLFRHKSKGLELLLNTVKVPERLIETLCEELKIPIFEVQEQVDLEEMK